MSEEEKGRVVDIDGDLHVCSDEKMEVEMRYLKEKCDAGGDVIITQLFYDFDVFATFVDKCRKIGIHAPILPGIMPLNAYGGFKRMTSFCKTRIPPAMAEKIAKLAGDDDEAKATTIRCASMNRIYDSLMNRSDQQRRRPDALDSKHR